MSIGGEEIGEKTHKIYIENFKEFIHEEQRNRVTPGWGCMYWREQCCREGEIAQRTKSLVRLKEVRSSSLAENVATFLVH